MPAEYDQHVAVTDLGEGRWSADLTEGWVVGGGVNGGYLLGVLGTALRAASPGKPDPLAVSAHYVSAAVPGPATLTTRLLRAGRGSSTLAAELWQGERLRVTALATYADLAAQPEEVRTTAERPAIPPLEQCVPGSAAPQEVRDVARMMDRFDMRFDPACVGWAVGEPSRRGELQAWFRLHDGREPDPVSLLTVVDVLPPVTMDLGLVGWAPTVQLTAHVRAVPAPGWLQVRHVTRNVAGGMFEEDCEVWDAAGRLVAQARQLAMLPR